MKSDLIDIDADLVHETEKAYLLDFGDKKEWIPKSCCEYDEDSGVVTMKESYALDKGLI